MIAAFCVKVWGERDAFTSWVTSYQYNGSINLFFLVAEKSSESLNTTCAARLLVAIIEILTRLVEAIAYYVKSTNSIPCAFIRKSLQTFARLRYTSGAHKLNEFSSQRPAKVQSAQNNNNSFPNAKIQPTDKPASPSRSALARRKSVFFSPRPGAKTRDSPISTARSRARQIQKRHLHL